MAGSTPCRAHGHQTCLQPTYSAAVIWLETTEYPRMIHLSDLQHCCFEIRDHFDAGLGSAAIRAPTSFHWERVN
jgi:hypothetical protein